ncbi:T9SS type B sorting domain-containing protein [Maribacter forsetii]|uniref:T9SS type B sorting domain-containing protein n=1 Tax=Maribacter forsetii TaxID=444515 RepID=UPI0005669E2D|nr:T9SS type B sorting domain-containing protein [Maribacter forsetii]
MRTLLCSICCLFLFYWNVTAQNSADCRTAIPVCADQPIMGLAGGTGDVDDFDPDVILQTGCLEKGSLSSANIEFNTSWFVFRAGTGGQVGFDIEALPSTGSTPTAEWDFAVYGPDVDCADISNGTAQPIRCNYEVNDTNFTGLGVNPESGEEGRASLTGSQNTYDEYLDVLPGEIYYILINNFADNFTEDPEPFMLTFTGSSVNADADTALDCDFRDEFLGLDIVACEGDDPITLSAMSSPAGDAIDRVEWEVDYDDDGVIDDYPAGSGDFDAELVIISPNTGRYFATVYTNASSGGPLTYRDDSGVLVTFYGTPIRDRIEILETNLSVDPDQNNIEIFVEGDGDFQYAINDGDFQDSPVFYDVPAGENSVIIRDNNNDCGTSEPYQFLVVGYPKFFTPNGDGINDTWNIKGIETLSNPAVFIFDRYGKLLKQLGPTDTWDGNFNGQQMPSTDYWFRFEYGEMEDDLLVAKTRKTHFTLKR